MILFAIPFLLSWGFKWLEFKGQNIILKALTPLLVLLIGIVVNELIHGVFLALFASEGIRSTSLGY